MTPAESLLATRRKRLSAAEARAIDAREATRTDASDAAKLAYEEARQERERARLLYRFAEIRLYREKRP